MIIQKDKVVSLSYELRTENSSGDIIETVDKSAPFSFLFGAGNLLPKFESNLDGLKIGDSFSFGLKAMDAYGEINDKAIVDVPKSAFEIDGKIDSNMLQIGNHIPMQDTSGNRLNGIVKKVTDTSVTMDFNHPLAGTNLHFSGEVTEIRDASKDELAHGHIHSGSNCSDNCDDCNDKECC